MMSACYSYICMAVAAALQMGLFSDSVHSLSKEDQAAGKTIAAVLFIVDTYVTTALGLPPTLREIDLESFAILDGLQEAAPETYAHVRLIEILAQLVDSNHPVTKRIPQSNGFYGVQYGNIVEAETRLGEWFDHLNVSSSTSASSEEVPFLR